MLEPLPGPEDTDAITERRLYPRRDVNSIVFVELAWGNAGVATNVGEGGLTLEADAALFDAHLTKIRFRLSRFHDWVETRGQLVWANQSKRKAGIQFVGLPQDALAQIRNWMSSDTPWEQFVEEVPASREAQEANPGVRFAIPDQPLPQESPADIVEREWNQGFHSSAVSAVIRGDSDQTPEPPPPTDQFEELNKLLAPKPEARSVDDDSSGAPMRHGEWAIAAVLSLCLVASEIAIWQRVRSPLMAYVQKAEDLAVRSGRTLGESLFPGPAPILTTIELGVIDTRARHWLVQFKGAPAAPFAYPISRRVVGSSGLLSEGVITAPHMARGDAAASGGLPRATGGDSVVPADDSTQVRGSTTGGPLILSIEPVYPLEAAESGVEGVVKLHAVIGGNGVVQTLRVLSGPPILIRPALAAARYARFKETLVQGRPVETEQDLYVVFRNIVQKVKQQ
jgi:hypothetical protein